MVAALPDLPTPGRRVTAPVAPWTRSQRRDASTVRRARTVAAARSLAADEADIARMRAAIEAERLATHEGATLGAAVHHRMFLGLGQLAAHLQDRHGVDVDGIDLDEVTAAHAARHGATVREDGTIDWRPPPLEH